jgi:quinol monooxygenase YgiN
MMTKQIVLIVRFRVAAGSKALLVEKLKEVFEHIRHEDTFVSASLQEDIADPEQLLVYEIWRETPESFMKNQITKPYRRGFEKAVSDLKVERTPQWLKPVAEWKR